MASSLVQDVGVAPSKQPRIKQLIVDATPVVSYATGGFTDAVLTAALSGFSLAESVAIPHHDGTTERWFKVNVATGKMQAFTTSSLAVEVAAAVDLSAHTSIRALLIGE
jgi:hypothetical protein